MILRRFLIAGGLLLGTAALAWGATRQVRPSTYELSINGEQFTVEADRRVTLSSRKTPGLKYEVALRIAPVQRLELSTIALDYDRGFAVTLEEGEGAPTASLQHELGFSLIVSDLGKALSPAEREKYMAGVLATMEKAAAAGAVGKVEKVAPAATDVEGGSGEVAVLHFRDRSELSRAVAIYVLNIGDTACSVVVQMLDDDAEDAQPLVDGVLDSLMKKK